MTIEGLSRGGPGKRGRIVEMGEYMTDRPTMAAAADV